jgi:hypothetical protein
LSFSEWKFYICFVLLECRRADSFRKVKIVYQKLRSQKWFMREPLGRSKIALFT